MISSKQLIPLLVLLGVLPTVAPLGFAQAPLNFGNNFFVTGDYIVAGAYNMTSSFQTIGGISYAVGTIKVPDANSKGVANPGIQGPTQVPKGAQVVAALLYWQTVEKVGVTPGGAGSGQNGYFRPVLTGGPAAPGYAISGTNLTSPGNASVSWSSGGCSGGSTGKLLRTYRADVAGGLPVDPTNGNSIANGSFEVRLPSSGNSAPLTLGATLVIIYRIPAGANGPNVPLKSIVIYDGDYGQNNTQLTMTQKLQGFYDADQNPISRLTHIVGSGQSNKFQTVYLSSGINPANPPNPLVALPSLYPKLPAFPGWYGTWDNPTWTFNSASTKPSNPMIEDASFATTQVVPSMSNQGCVSWGAIIVSTTVKNSDDDGILDVWKYNRNGPYPGYCDAAFNNGSCNGPGDPAWVDLTGALPNQKDLFLQYDYMCSKVQGAPSPGNGSPANTGDNSCSTTGVDYSFDPRLGVDPAGGKTAVEKVVDAFDNHQPFVLHAIPGNAILESDPNVTCKDTIQTGPTCTFPQQAGTVGFREGVAYIKNQTIDTKTGMLGCTPPGTVTDPCVAVFQHGKKDSYHYALFSHGVGLPSWFLSDGSITMTQSTKTVTFVTSSPHGLAHIMGDTACPSSPRVTIASATSNPNLNGSYCATVVNSTKFTVTVAANASVSSATYTYKTDPNLALVNGQVTSMSGFSDVGGQNSVISLGYGGWGLPTNPTSDGNKWQTKAGTFMHELGHTLGLTHGGTWYNKLGSNPPDYTPLFEPNCKPNVQTSMSYLFQVDLLEAPGGQLDSLGQPLMVVDYSKQALPTLTENSPQAAGFLSGADYANTSWYQLQAFAGGTPVGGHCDGSPLLGTDQSMSYVSDSVGNFFWSNTNPPGVTGNDINFDGNPNEVLHGHDEWDGTQFGGVVGSSPGLDLQQVSALGTISAIGPGGEAGVAKPGGGGGVSKPGGGGGVSKPGGGGGVAKPGGGGGLNSDITHEQANSYARPPRGLVITQEEASPRLIDLSWFVPTFGQIVQYNIYRSAAGVAGGQFVLLTNVPGTQTTFTDTVSCNTGGYHYQVTSVVNNDAPPPPTLESVPSNTVPAAGEPKLTGCYTVSGFTVPTIAVQGDTGLQVAWTLSDDFYVSPGTPWAQAASGNPVTRGAANTLVAIGPLPGNCTQSGRTKLVVDGAATNQFTSQDAPGPDTFSANNNTFTFTWNNSDAFCAGQYTFELDLDHVSGSPAQTQAGPNPLQLSIDINDQDTPHITTPALPGGTVGLAYTTTLTEDGGTGPTFNWTVTGLPSGISQQALNSPTITGTTCAAGSYPVSAIVTDSAHPANSGSQGFSFLINKATPTTSVGSDANPSFFQQTVTFTVIVAPQHGCVPTGTVTLLDGVTPIASNLALNGSGVATFSTYILSVATHSITATYSGDANFNPSSSGVFSQTVNKAVTATALSSVLPSPAFVGQPISVSFTFGVVAPGAGTPTPPSGSITVLASDHSTCTVPAVLGGGMCTLVPPPTTPGNRTFTITYAGDGNFVASGDNGNYDVNQLVFTTQPSNTGVSNTITPAVVVTAEDSSSNPLTTFTGGITVAIGSGTGTLSGTLTQNAVAGAATFNDLSINKIANGYTLTAAPSGGVPDATSSAFNIDTFYVDASGNFGTLDLATGTTTQIATATVPNSTGIDLTPTLQVYTYNTSGQLMQITPSSGAATPVGSTGSIPDQATTGALTDGSYFGIDSVTGNLYSIDHTAGTKMQVGTSSTAPVPAGCNFEASLTGSTNVLYYTIGYSGCSSPMPDTLYQIDPTTGSVTASVQVTISGNPVNAFAGSAFVGGTLYGFTTDKKEYSIDPASGVARLLNNTSAAAPIVGAGSSQ